MCLTYGHKSLSEPLASFCMCGGSRAMNMKKRTEDYEKRLDDGFLDMDKLSGYKCKL